MAHAIHYRGWRDAFHGREVRSADPTYLEGYTAGLRDGDRTTTRLVAGSPGLVSDSQGTASGDEADLSHEAP